jgi:hypothetical protein
VNIYFPPETYDKQPQQQVHPLMPLAEDTPFAAKQVYTVPTLNRPKIRKFEPRPLHLRAPAAVLAAAPTPSPAPSPARVPAPAPVPVPAAPPAAAARTVFTAPRRTTGSVPAGKAKAKTKIFLPSVALAPAKPARGGKQPMYERVSGKIHCATCESGDRSFFAGVGWVGCWVAG